MDRSIQSIRDLYQRYGGAVYDKCLRILNVTADAQDATQETFIRAYQALDTFVYGDSYLPWLYRIATNICISHIRTRKRIARASEQPAMMAVEPKENMTRALHMRRILGRLVDQLDERTLEIMVAYYFDGMDQEQIGRHLGISRRAVAKRLSILRLKVQRELEHGAN